MKDDKHPNETPIHILLRHRANLTTAVLSKKDMLALKVLGIEVYPTRFHPLRADIVIQASHEDVRVHELKKKPYDSLITSVQRSQWVAGHYISLLEKGQK